jgi:hypothetical protein
MFLRRPSVLSVATLLSALPLLIPGPSAPLAAQELRRAAMAGKVEAVLSILREGTQEIDRPDASGYTPLRWAGIRGEGAIANLLLDAGADPNTVGADGGTPLHGAAHHDDGEMMAALLAAGGDVGIKNQWGRTPLHVAARRGCMEVATLLLEAGADPNAVTGEGWTPLNVAYRGGHPEMVELLLAHGADPGFTDENGLRPGDVRLVRPQPVSLSRRVLDKYVGEYDLGGGFGFTVWREGDTMFLREFAPDRMVPVAVDTFLTVQEPWKVVFDRDEEGKVVGMDVDFLRRTVSARKVLNPSEGFTYVGTRTCLACHQSGPGSGPAGHWVASRHSRSFHTLTTRQARNLAAGREEYRDMTDPSTEQRCLMCHVTAARDEGPAWSPDAQGPSEGAGCEACHGPGSAYIAPEIMADTEAFLANGGRVPDEITCRGCHRDENFRFETYWERIRHGG